MCGSRSRASCAVVHVRRTLAMATTTDYRSGQLVESRRAPALAQSTIPHTSLRKILGNAPAGRINGRFEGVP